MGLILDVRIRNIGTATAYDMFSVIAHNSSFVPLVTRIEGVRLLHEQHNSYSATTPGKHLHPGLNMGLLRLAFPQFTSENKGPIEMVLTVDIYSKDGEPIRWLFECTHYDLVKTNHQKEPTRRESILHRTA